jgi:hypothetical protein
MDGRRISGCRPNAFGECVCFETAAPEKNAGQLNPTGRVSRQVRVNPAICGDFQHLTGEAPALFPQMDPVDFLVEKIIMPYS